MKSLRVGRGVEPTRLRGLVGHAKELTLYLAAGPWVFSRKFKQESNMFRFSCNRVVLASVWIEGPILEAAEP